MDIDEAMRDTLILINKIKSYESKCISIDAIKFNVFWKTISSITSLKPKSGNELPANGEEMSLHRVGRDLYEKVRTNLC